MQDRKMQDWNMLDKSAGLEIARLENDRLENGLVAYCFEDIGLLRELRCR